jgi:hypothetical protein
MHAELVTVDGVEFWDLPRLPDIKPAEDDLLYEVKDTDRIDMIANMRLKDPRLWDIIAQANEYRLIPNELKPGTLIRLPSIARTLSELRNKQ